MPGLSRCVGVLGGMFDPVHFGHLQAASVARDCCRLDEVALVPCGNPVHRQSALSPAAQRCTMLELAIGDTSWLRLDRRECDSAAPSRSFDTLSAMAADKPGDILHFILGMDAFLTLASWYRWRELFQLAHFIVIRRPGYALSGMALNATLSAVCEGRWAAAGSRVGERCGRIFVADTSTRNLSSTEVRAALQQGGIATELVPPDVADYIARHHLYQ